MHQQHYQQPLSPGFHPQSQGTSLPPSNWLTIHQQSYAHVCSANLLHTDNTDILWDIKDAPARQGSYPPLNK